MTMEIPPDDIILKPGSVVTFPCVVTSDPGRALEISWLRSGNPIVFEYPRIYKNMEHSLVINTTSEEDGGHSFLATYSCVARNGLRKLVAEARLKPNSEGMLTAGEFAPILEGHHPTDKGGQMNIAHTHTQIATTYNIYNIHIYVSS